jgi:hypothetical protein
MRRLALTVATLLVAAPAAFAGGPSSHANTHATVKACKNLKAQMGARNFNAAFAPNTHSARAALRNCARREAAAQAQARTNAARTCRAWRNDPAAFETAMAGTANEGKTFAQVFGTGANAYGKCVSTVARQQNAERRAALVNAAHTCRTWKSDSAAFAAAMQGTANEGKTFADVFGSGANAYGKCVSQEARAASSS